jgi:CyaY protein
MRREMNKVEFHRLANQEINYLLAKIEEQDSGGVLDADILDEILTITLPDNKQYVINKQSYVQQIWLSSPFTGAYHFDYNSDKNMWLARKSEELRQLLSKELTNNSSVKLLF